MSRSILLIICDFLLLSLLALARFDKPEDDYGSQEQTPEERAAADAAADRDFVEVLRMSLEAERLEAENLNRSLKEMQEALEVRETSLQEKEVKLSDLEKSSRELAERHAAAEKARIEAEAERQRLAREFEENQKRLREADSERLQLARTLAEAKEASATSSERLRAMQEEMQRQQAQLTELQSERERLDRERRIAEQERIAAEHRLQVAQMEAKVFATTLETARADIEATREEKRAILQTADRLAEGVGVLAESTKKIQEEVKQLQPQSLNALFDRYRRNKVRLSFQFEESGLLGTSEKPLGFDTLLVSDGERTYALASINATPFSRSGIKQVSAHLEMGGRIFRVPQVGFLASDPRIVVVAVPNSLPAETGIEPFALAKDALRYPDAVLISSNDNYYGESPFRLDPENPRYVRFRSDLFSRIFGDFSPRRGDLVLAKTGEFLGIMVNNQYALVVPALGLRANLSLGDRFDPVRADEVRRMVNGTTSSLPGDLR